MKLFVILALLIAAPAAAQDDCPAGHVRHPQVSPLDHAYMVRAFTASFRGIFGREPSMQQGSGVDDGEYYIAAADHFGVYGDDQCHAGWSGYWESWLQNGHGDLTLVQTPARFLPNLTPPVVVPPVVVPPVTPPAPVPDLTDRVEHLEELLAHLQQGVIAIEGRIQALEARTIYTQCRASVFGIAVSCSLK